MNSEDLKSALTPLDLTGLTPEAQRQAADVCKSTMRQYNVFEAGPDDYIRQVSPCLYAVIPIRLTEDGAVPEECRSRWINMLNDLVKEDFWDKGALNPGSFIESTDYSDLSFLEGRRGYLFTVLFSTKVRGLDVRDPAAQANRIVGFPIFRNLYNERSSLLGDLDKAWQVFPW